MQIRHLALFSAVLLLYLSNSPAQSTYDEHHFNVEHSARICDNQHAFTVEHVCSQAAGISHCACTKVLVELQSEGDPRFTVKAPHKLAVGGSKCFALGKTDLDVIIFEYDSANQVCSNATLATISGVAAQSTPPGLDAHMDRMKGKLENAWKEKEAREKAKAKADKAKAEAEAAAAKAKVKADAAIAKAAKDKGR